MVATTDFLNHSLQDISAEDLKTMLTKIQDELKGRRTTKDMIAELKAAYAKIDWGGGDWKSEKTSDAVGELGRLDSCLVEKIVDAIHAQVDAEAQWEAALELSLELVRMISEAEGFARKLVNGSMGEWCPDTAKTIGDLWSKLASNREKNASLSKHQCEDVYQKLHGSLGDYDYCTGLNETLDGIKNSERKNLKRKIDVVDLVD